MPVEAGTLLGPYQIHSVLGAAPDVKSLATSMRLAQSDIWIMEGLDLPGTLFSLLWPLKKTR